MMLVASWDLFRLICQSREVKSGRAGARVRTAAIPRPSGPWQAVQRVPNIAPAAVLTVVTGIGEGNTPPRPAGGEGGAGPGAGPLGPGGVGAGPGCGREGTW